MERRRKYVGMVLLAVAIPAAFIIGFLTFQQSSIVVAETIKVSPAVLEFDRPSKDIDAPGVANSYRDEGVLVNVSTASVKYSEQGFIGNKDYVEVWLWINTSAFQGFVYSVEFECSVDNSSTILDGKYYYVQMWNVSVLEHNSTVNQLYYKFEVDSSTAAILVPLNWIFPESSSNATDHQLVINTATIHCNGTAYRKIVIPLKLRITKDIGNTFKTAKHIQPGKHLGSLDTADRADIYAINLENNEVVFINLTILADANFDLRLYDQNYKEVANSTQLENQKETITYAPNTSGIYYIKIEFTLWPGHKCDGIYQLDIKPFEE